MVSLSSVHSRAFLGFAMCVLLKELIFLWVVECVNAIVFSHCKRTLLGQVYMPVRHTARNESWHESHVVLDK